MRAGIRRVARARPVRAALVSGAALAALCAWVPGAAAQTSGGSGSDTSSSGSTDNSAPDSGLSGLGSGPPGVPPIAGAILPSTGFDPNQSDLRNHLLNSFRPGAAPSPQPGSAQVRPGRGNSRRLDFRHRESLTDNADQFAGYGYRPGNQRRAMMRSR